MLAVITAPYFRNGVEEAPTFRAIIAMQDDVVVKAGNSINCMAVQKWTRDRVRDHCRKMEWRITTTIPDPLPPDVELPKGPGEITLTRGEVEIGTACGIARNREATLDGRKHIFERGDPSAWHQHIEGALGEIAAARVIDRHWAAPINTFGRGADIGETIQVRTRSVGDYELPIHDTDKDTDTFILVVGLSPHYRVVGWIPCGLGKLEKYWTSHGGPPAFFVPQNVLSPIGTFPETVR